MHHISSLKLSMNKYYVSLVFMKPKVTIGMCVKDSEATINEAIESILNQDFPCELMELVVVDGNSKDKTLNILENCLKKASIRTKIFHENGGLGQQRQKVVENASGEYIVWIDGDMILSKDYVTRMVEFMEQHPKAGIAKGRPSIKYKCSTLSLLETLYRYAEKTANFQSKNAYSKTLGTGGSIYRTQVIKQVGGFDKSLKYYCEDWDAEIRIKAAGWFRVVTDGEYIDYERYGLTWKTLWRKYWLRGYYTHYFLHKHPGLIKHYRMFPPAAFVAGLLHVHKLFKLTRKKIVFLLPFQYLFKMTAWYIGFIKSHP